MNNIVDHYIASSLKEYLNYRTLVDLGAFKTVTGQLVPYTRTKWSGKEALGSSFAQWVYDTSVPGAQVATAVSGIPGATPDYINGRFLVPTGASTTGISSVFSYNEINFYVSTSSESKLIFETNFLHLPDYRAATGYLPEGSIVAPCVFVKSYQSDSDEFALGGLVKSRWNFKIVVMVNSDRQLLGIQKVVREARQNIFPILTNPVLDKYNNLNSIGWNYLDESNEAEDYGLITDSTFKIQENDLFTEKNPAMQVGLGNIEVSYFSNPRFRSSVTPTQLYYLGLNDDEFALELNDQEGFLESAYNN